MGRKETKGKLMNRKQNKYSKKEPRHVLCVLSCLSCVRLFETLWTIAHQAPRSIGFSRQEYWSGLSFPPPEDLPDPGIESASPALVSRFFTTEPPGKPSSYISWFASSNPNPFLPQGF